jgi:hypothetical protein
MDNKVKWFSKETRFLGFKIRPITLIIIIIILIVVTIINIK